MGSEKHGDSVNEVADESSGESRRLKRTELLVVYDGQ